MCIDLLSVEVGDCFLLLLRDNVVNICVYFGWVGFSFVILTGYFLVCIGYRCCVALGFVCSLFKVSWLQVCYWLVVCALLWVLVTFCLNLWVNDCYIGWVYGWLFDLCWVLVFLVCT